MNEPQNTPSLEQDLEQQVAAQEITSEHASKKLAEAILPSNQMLAEVLKKNQAQQLMVMLEHVVMNQHQYDAMNSASRRGASDLDIDPVVQDAKNSADQKRALEIQEWNKMVDQKKEAKRIRQLARP